MVIPQLSKMIMDILVVGDKEVSKFLLEERALGTPVGIAPVNTWLTFTRKKECPHPD